jgi:hypothetical protein
VAQQQGGRYRPEIAVGETPAELHGGSLKLDSTPDQRTRAIITLPPELLRPADLS